MTLERIHADSSLRQSSPLLAIPQTTKTAHAATSGVLDRVDRSGLTHIPFKRLQNFF